MLYNIGVLKNLRKFMEKTPVLESLFNKGVGLRSSTLLIRHSSTGFLVNFKKFLKNNFFTEHLLTTASVILYKYQIINKYNSGLSIFQTSTGWVVSTNLCWILKSTVSFALKGNAQFVQKVTFKPLMDFKQKHYGSWKYSKSCYF